MGRFFKDKFESFPPSPTLRVVLQIWLPPACLASPELVVFFLTIASCASRLIRLSGANREVKKAVEAYWAGKISADVLTKAAAEVKKTSWISVKAKGVDFVPRSDRISID